ncbi:glutaredoxin 3 [Candidatus Pantoea edessiphila]|uniref:Glutaredoxin 3 n=1 Tax=Candidatus Pantoea edessiphila TaxID=2044610 RepID=A0A2P5SZ10_9GAMM|nr:glutaredoxin domain-containing protein [Candidatus Pantoea edessiphila]MBK4775280.1 glutaredoxin 3 [Pantoea sp. Edef]PPI87581.1 glutaredoxin 3 [Candidatus Pantoea edessiphila]
MYTKKTCNYYIKARILLNIISVVFQETFIDKYKNKYQEVVLRSSYRTVSQMFISGKFIGGFDELLELDRKNTFNFLQEF